MTDKILNVHQRINAVMAEAPVIARDKDIKSGNKILYSVISSDAVTKAMQPLYTKHGINVISTVTDHRQDGNRTIVDIDVDIINIDAPTDRHKVKSFGYGIDTSDKGPGKAMSYACRYAQVKAFNIEAGDPDNEDGDEDHKQNPISDEQLITLQEICESKEFPVADTLKRLATKVFGLKEIKELPVDKFEIACKRLNDK